MKILRFIFAVTALGAVVLNAQTPIPIVVAAATPSAVSQPKSQPAATVVDPTSLKLLEEMKAANAETLRKQEATLQQLDELEKSADQIKIYTKRG
jgi:hypothetical protein